MASMDVPVVPHIILLWCCLVQGYDDFGEQLFMNLSSSYGCLTITLLYC